MSAFILGFLILVFVGFGVYALVTQYKDAKGGSVPARVAAAIGLAMAALGGAIVQLAQSFGG